MKFYRFLISSLAIAALCVFTGCDDDEEDNYVVPATVKVSPTSLSFDIDGGAQTLSVTTEGDWTMSNTNNWVSVSAESGNGDATLTVSVDDNYDSAARSANIVFSNPEGTSSVSVLISQNGELSYETLSLSDGTIDFGYEGGSQTVAVISNVDWTATAGESWITVAPVSANGTQGVSVTVPANPDEPRAGEVVFNGGSGLTVTLTVTQDGEDYANAGEYSVAEICALSDGTAVSLPKAYVALVPTGMGYIVSDDFKTFIYVSDETSMNLGDEVAILGRKSTNTYGLPVILVNTSEKGSTGNTVTYPTAEAINAGNVETYASTSWSYVCVTGMLNGDAISTKVSTKYSVEIVDAPGMSYASYNGTKVNFYGFFGGKEMRTLRIIGTSVADGGSTVLLDDNFDWIIPYAEAADAGDNISTGISTTNAPEVTSDFLEEWAERGYEFVTSDGTRAAYLQMGYLKLGGTNTTHHCGVKLPKFDDIIDGSDLELSFMWAPMRGGGVYYDRVCVDVMVNDELIERFYHNGVDYAGTNNGDTPLITLDETVLLKGVSADDDIFIRSYAWDVAASGTYPYIGGTHDNAYQRWFLDNPKVVEAY